MFAKLIRLAAMVALATVMGSLFCAFAGVSLWASPVVGTVAQALMTRN